MGRRIAIGSMLIAGVIGSGFLLGGCVPSGSSADAEHIRDLILAEGNGVEDVLVNFKTDVFVQDVSVALSMPESDKDDVDQISLAVDAALEIAWQEAPFEPSDIAIHVRLEPFADNATANFPRGIRVDFQEVGNSLGVQGYIGINGMSASRFFLIDAYGPRQ